MGGGKDNVTVIIVNVPREGGAGAGASEPASDGVSEETPADAG
jgi:hypothetical protein